MTGHTGNVRYAHGSLYVSRSTLSQETTRSRPFVEVDTPVLDGSSGFLDLYAYELSDVYWYTSYFDINDGQFSNLLLAPSHEVKCEVTLFYWRPGSRDKSHKMIGSCLLYTSPSPRDLSTSRMPSSA